MASLDGLRILKLEYASGVHFPASSLPSEMHFLMYSVRFTG